jgi:galactofuranose transport system permease protein
VEASMKLLRSHAGGVYAALAVLLLLWTAGGLRFDHFASPGTAFNLLSDYAFVAIAACGATLVILSGGIDLSCGSMIAFSGMLAAALVQSGWQPVAALLACVVGGLLVGIVSGTLIHKLALPAFIVTLAAMFALRAAAFLVHDSTLTCSHPFIAWINEIAMRLPGGAALDARIVVLAVVSLITWLIADGTPFGMANRAIGGCERSARMMGLSLGFTRIVTYALASGLSALAGVVHAFRKSSGDPNGATGLELTVIAAVVIGGTRLSGGVGSVWGSIIGVCIIGTIRTLIDFEGTLNAAWTSVATGALLFVFVVAQRAIRGGT